MVYVETCLLGSETTPEQEAIWWVLVKYIICSKAQGCILSPISFLMHVNDLPAAIPSLSIFAIDTRLFIDHHNLDELVSF